MYNIQVHRQSKQANHYLTFLVMDVSSLDVDVRFFAIMWPSEALTSSRANSPVNCWYNKGICGFRAVF